MFGVAGSAPTISLRSVMPCQCTDVGLSSRFETATTSSSPMRARISGPGMVLPKASVRTIGPPRSICDCWGVRLAVTVRPLCGRAASAAAMAADIWAALPDAWGLVSPQAANAIPPAMPAAMKPRLVSCAPPKRTPLVGSTGFIAPRSGRFGPGALYRARALAGTVSAHGAPGHPPRPRTARFGRRPPPWPGRLARLAPGRDAVFMSRLMRSAARPRGLPVAEPGGVDRRVFAVDGNDGAFVEPGTEILGRGVAHDLAWIVGRGKGGPDEVVHAALFGAGDVGDAVGRIADRCLGDGRGDVLGGDGLERTIRQPDRVAVGCRIGNGVDEFEELSRAHDRIWASRFHDQLLLGNLGPHVATVWGTVGTHDRERDVVLHTCRPLRGEKVSRRGGEEVHHGFVVEGWRVGEVDNRIGTRYGLGETFAGDGVDTRARRGRDRLVSQLGQIGNDLRADQSCATDNQNLHDLAFPRCATNSEFIIVRTLVTVTLGVRGQRATDAANHGRP